MKNARAIAALLLLGSAFVSAEGKEFPVREKLERDGWTISFAPADRDLAEGLTERLREFEERFTAIEMAKGTFGPAELEARAADAAVQTAAWCALPGRTSDFQREFELAALRVSEIQAQVRAALLVRAIDLWRTEAMVQHLTSDDGIPGVRWLEESKRPEMNVRIKLMAHLEEGGVSVNMSVPPAVMLQIPDQLDPAATVVELAGGFDAWADYVGTPNLDPGPVAMRITARLGIARIIGSEVAPDPSSRWIIGGLSSWLWRELVLSTLKPEGTYRYAATVPGLLVPGAVGKRLDLEQWSEGEEDENLNRAQQVFCNIATRHGNKAVTRVLAQFWKLPAEQRTSAGLKAVYRELMSEPLEALAPWRSLGRGP